MLSAEQEKCEDHFLKSRDLNQLPTTLQLDVQTTITPLRQLTAEVVSNEVVLLR